VSDTIGTSSATSTGTPLVLAPSRAAAWLVTTAFVALFIYFVIGVDQGATTLFGKNMLLHEFVHDGRHFLGFPCH
jgi:Probable cobalt transporter subunit (CbtB)